MVITEILKLYLIFIFSYSHFCSYNTIAFFIIKVTKVKGIFTPSQWEFEWYFYFVATFCFLDINTENLTEKEFSCFLYISNVVDRKSVV